jgi:pimeloyl-ACP methyl ester carboxylesterase
MPQARLLSFDVVPSRTVILLAGALAALSGGRSMAEESPAPRNFEKLGPHAVGVRTLVLVDTSRLDSHTGKPRTLMTDVWYPAVEESRGKPPTRFVDFFSGNAEVAELFVNHFGGKLVDVERRFRSVAVRDAALRKGTYPLLVFSHGNGGVRHQSSMLLDHLASHGYIVASPDHTGNAGVTVQPDGIVVFDKTMRSLSMQDRPIDARFVIDQLLRAAATQGNWLEGALDKERIGALGHSFGGYTVCQLAGMDPRVKAILPMTLVSFRTFSVPALVMIGDLDRTVGSSVNGLVNRAAFRAATGPRHLLALRKGGHFSFSDMDNINPNFGDGIGVETRGGKKIEYLAMDRTKEIIGAYAVAFFDSYLRKDARAAAYLRENHYGADIEIETMGVE